MLLSRGTKFKNNKKTHYLKIYPPIKLNPLSVIFILKHININIFIDPAKICMTLLVPETFQRNLFSYYKRIDRYLINGVSKSIVHGIKHVNFQLNRVYSDGIVWKT